jgi:hypothetical protein
LERLRGQVYKNLRGDAGSGLSITQIINPIQYPEESNYCPADNNMR